MDSKEAMKLALEAAYLAGFNASGEGYNGEYPFQDHNAHPAQDEGWCKNRDAYIRALAEQPAQDNTYGYAKYLAEAMFKRHFASDEHYASGRVVWGVNDTVIGILTQIDNMVADMVRKPAQQEPLLWAATVNLDSLLDSDDFARNFSVTKRRGFQIPIYTSQPQRTWVGLTVDEIEECYSDKGYIFARAIEAKLKEKNT